MGAEGFSVTTKDTAMSEPLLSLRAERPAVSIADWESHLKSLAAGLEKDTQHEWAMFAAGVLVPAAFARPGAWIALLGGTAAAASQYLYQRLGSPEKDIELLPIVGAGLIGALGTVAGIRVFKWITTLAAEEGAVMASGMTKASLRETGRIFLGRTPPKPPRSRGHLRIAEKAEKPDNPLPPTPPSENGLPHIPVTPSDRVAAAGRTLSVPDTATQAEKLLELPEGTLRFQDLRGPQKLDWNLLGLRDDRAYTAAEIQLVRESFGPSLFFDKARDMLIGLLKKP